MRVSATPGGWNVLSPQSDSATGLRRRPQLGNAQQASHLLLNLAGLTNLAAGSTCYWSVQAVDAAWAGSAFASEGVFIVPGAPAVVTLPAADIAQTQATLKGTVNPNGLPTQVWFRWGATADYGNLTDQSSLGNGGQVLPLSATLSGLAALPTYHYQMVASNSLGVVSGADMAFTTPPAPPCIGSCSLPGASAFQISFTGATNTSYTVLSATNLALPLSNWTALGTATESASGQYQFTDTTATNARQFYRLLWP